MNRLSTFVSFTQWLQSVVQLYVIGHKSSVVCMLLVSTVTYRVEDGCRKTGKFATEHVCSKKKFCKHVCVHTRARTSYLQSQPSYCNSLWKPWFFEFLSWLKFAIQWCRLWPIVLQLDTWSCWTISHLQGLHGLPFYESIARHVCFLSRLTFCHTFRPEVYHLKGLSKQESLVW